MPPAVRFGDICSGHGCFSPRPNDQGSPDVFINNLPSHRLTDHWVTHCLTGDTEIRLLSGESVRIDSLVGNFEGEFVYSCTEDGRIVPGKIVDAFLSSKAKTVYEIELDNDQSFMCSSDHLIMLRSGEYVMAKHLQLGVSLMPLYTDLNERGYEILWDNLEECWVTTHKMSALSNIRQHLAAQQRVGRKRNKFLVVHHKNFKKRDNRPTNLKWMGNQDHFLYHSHHGHNIWMNMSPERRALLSKRASKRAKKQAARQLADGTHNFLADHPMLKSRNRKKIAESNRRRLAEGTHHFIHANPMLRAECVQQMKKTKRRMWKLLPESEKLRIREIRRMASQRLIKAGIHHTQTDNPMKRAEVKDAMCRSKIVRIYKAIRQAGLAFNRHTYEEFYFSSAPGWKKVKQYFESPRELAEYAKYNHAVVGIKKHVFDFPIALYDLTIENREKTHNFALGCGIFVHNCCVSCHDSVACQGSPNVFVNNLNKCRIGDAVCCGSVMAMGSPNVITN